MDASRDADAEVGRVQQELTNAHEELAALSQTLAAQGTMSSADIDREVQQLLGDLGVDEHGASTLEATLRRESIAADHSVKVAQEQLSATQRHASTLRADLNDLVSRLDAEPWLVRAAGGPLRGPSGEPDTARYWIARMAVLSSLTRLQKASDRIQRLEGLCRDFLKSPSDGLAELDEQTRQFTPAFTQLFSARLLDALCSPSIRLRLFDRAEPIELDAVHRTLVLRRPDGVTERRPLSSYSTGEQAFAFPIRAADPRPASSLT